MKTIAQANPGNNIRVNPGDFTGLTDMSLSDAILAVINAFLIFVTIAAIVMIIIGGIRYIVSQGDDRGTEVAKKTILYAVIGLIVVGLSLAIVTFVQSALD